LVFDFFVKKARLEYELLWLEAENDFQCSEEPLLLPKVRAMEEWSLSVVEERRQRLFKGEDDVLDPLQIGALLTERSAVEELRQGEQLQTVLHLETDDEERAEEELQTVVQLEAESSESSEEEEEEPSEPEMTVEVLASCVDNSFREMKDRMETQSQLLAEQVARSTTMERSVWRCLSLLKRQRGDLTELLDLGRGQMDFSKDWKTSSKSSVPPSRKRRDTGGPGEGCSTQLFPETLAFCATYDSD
jgi:hypothetical protein